MDFKVSAFNKTFLEGVVKDLSRVRQWVAGFEAAGGKGPPHIDGVRWAQVILGEAKALDEQECEEGREDA